MTHNAVQIKRPLRLAARISTPVWFLLASLFAAAPAPTPAQNLSLIFFQKAEERGDLEAAELHLSRLIKDFPANPAFRARRAYVRSQRGNLEGSIEDAREIIRQYPSLPLGHVQLLHAQSVTATTEEHLAMLDKVAPRLQEEPIGLTTLASHRHYLGQIPEAIEAMDKAIDILQNPFNPDPNSLPRARGYRALLLYDAGRTDEALAALAEAQIAHPGNEDVEEIRLELLIAEGRLPEALSFFKRLFGQRPKASLNTWFDRAQAYYMTGQYSKARADLEEALRRAPIDSHSRIAIPAMMLLEGKPAEAERFLDRNMDAILRDRLSARQTSNSLVNRRQDAVSLEMLGVSTINPYFNRAIARALQNKRREAIADAERAAKGADPFHPYEPAKDLLEALRSGARIKLDPRPLSLEEVPGIPAPVNPADLSTTEAVRGLLRIFAPQSRPE